MRPLSRRRLLSLATSGGSLALAGCLGAEKSVRYRLSAGTVPGTLAERFRWESRGPDPEADRALIETLVEDGSLTTAGFVLAEPNGTRYVESEGTFYEITVEQTGTVDREHWIFWFDLLDGDPPTDAEVFTSSHGTGPGTDLGEVYGLSQRDQRVVEDAAGEVVREFDLHDPAEDPPGRRGYVFLRRGEPESDLLPEPPFTHVAFEVNDETHHARAVTERASVELQQYTYHAERVADSAEAYADVVQTRFLETAFDRSGLPSAQREILDAITRGGGRYEERAPLSEAFDAVLERLSLAGVETPDPRRVSFSETVYFEYRGGTYDAQLELFG